MFSESDLLILTNDLWSTKIDPIQRRRKVWVIVADIASGHTEMEFLKKILAAVHLDLDKDACLIVASADTGFSLANLYEGGKPDKIIVFGLKPTDIGINAQFKHYVLNAFYGSNWLFSDDLTTLESDKQKKGLLWAALKAMFG